MVSEAGVEAFRARVHAIARRLGLWPIAPTSKERARTAMEVLKLDTEERKEYERLIEHGTRRKRAIRLE